MPDTSVSCRACGTAIAYGSVGRPPTACSPQCKRANRAADARARRAVARPPRPSPARPSPEVVATTARVRQRLRESAAERADAYEAAAAHLATLADFAPSDTDVPLSLGDLGLSSVRPARGGRGTVWASDAAQHRQADYRARDAARIREECRAAAVRKARAAARNRGVFLCDDDPALVEALAIGDADADRILGALFGDALAGGNFYR